MSFLDKLAFWKKKDDLDSFDTGVDNFDLGLSQNTPNQPTSQPQDPMNFQGVGDFHAQKQMNQSINNQLGPDYMNPDSDYSSYSPPKQNFAPQQPKSHEMEVVMAKLDAIRATLDSVNQRLANLERIAYGEQDNQKRRYNW